MRDLFRMAGAAVAAIALLILGVAPTACALPPASAGAQAAPSLDVLARQRLLVASDTYVATTRSLAGLIRRGAFDAATIGRITRTSDRVEALLLKAHDLSDVAARLSAADEALALVGELTTLLPAGAR